MVPASSRVSETSPGGISAAASAELFGCLTNKPHIASIIGRNRYVIWVESGSTIIAITRPDKLRLPNGIELSVLDGQFKEIVGEHLVLGNNQIGFQNGVATLVRWWNPRVYLPSCKKSHLTQRIKLAEDQLDRPNDHGLEAALSENNLSAFCKSVVALLGRGEGLTPWGDDLLLGAIAAMKTVNTQNGCTSGIQQHSRIASFVLRQARARTNAISSSLLCYALSGSFAKPIIGFLRALVGQDRLDLAIDSLVRVGHSSGTAIAQGILIGSRVKGSREE